MKKVLLVCVLVALAASAQAAYVWNINSTDTAGANYGTAVTVGDPANANATQSVISTNASYAAAVVYSGGLDATFSKDVLRSRWFTTTPPQEWIIQAWSAGDYAMSTFDFRLWGGTTNVPTGTWYLYKYYDPFTQVWDTTSESFVSTVTAVAGGTQASPALKLNLPAFKTNAPTAAGQGYIFALRNTEIAVIPEPGSMVAMLSGLVGLVGFGIRRRR